MKKAIKQVLSTLSAIALISSSFVTMQASAEDVPYLNIYNDQGTYAAGDNKLVQCIGTRELVTKDPVMGDYTNLTGSFVHVCEGNANQASLWIDNIEAGRMTVVEADFKPDENTQLVHLYTYYTTKYTYTVDLTQLGDIVKVGEWNHIKVLADTSVYAKDNNGTTMDRVPSSVWINGVQVLAMSLGKYGSVIKLASIKERFAANATSQFVRLRFDAKSGTTTTVGIDNTVIKTVDSDATFNANYNGYLVQNSSVINSTIALENGLAGKASDDGAMSLTGSTDSGYIESYVPAGSKYIVQDFDFLPGEGFVNFITKSRNQTLTYDMLRLLSDSTEGRQRIKPNQWNHMTIISDVLNYDLETGECTMSTDAYVNGVNIGAATRTWKTTDASYLEFSDGAGRGRTYYPFRWGFQAAGVTNYYDNFKVIVTNEKPVPTSIGKINSVSGKVAVTAPTRYNNGIVEAEGLGITPADLTITGGSVRVYTDDTYATVVADDAAIAEGNVIVATDANGILTYYDFEEFEAKNTTLLDIDFNDGTLKGTVGKVTTPKGIFDYAVVDGDTALSITNKASANEADAFAIFTEVPTKDQVVIEFNVMPTDDNLGTIRVGTGWSNPIFPEVKAEQLVKNQWNHIVAYVNTIGEKVQPNATTYQAMASVSVNGSEFSTPIKVSPRTTAEGACDLRFCAYAKSTDITTTALFDDIKVTTSNYEYVPEINPSEVYIVKDNGIVKKDGERVGMYYTLLVNKVSDKLTLGFEDAAFTITELGDFDVATSLTYMFEGARALGDIPAVASVKSGDTTYSKIK